MEAIAFVLEHKTVLCKRMFFSLTVLIHTNPKSFVLIRIYMYFHIAQPCLLPILHVYSYEHFSCLPFTHAYRHRCLALSCIKSKSWTKCLKNRDLTNYLPTDVTLLSLHKFTKIFLFIRIILSARNEILTIETLFQRFLRIIINMW